MKDKFLRTLNFDKLLKYPDKFPVKNDYPVPIKCKGFCVDCEKKGIIDRIDTSLTYISHGCKTEDYISILGNMPNTNVNDKKVMFVLEQPGGNLRYDLGEWVEFEGVKKYPPVKHYYWTPSSDTWLTTIPDVQKEKNFYGNYFGYLINKYGFLNCYITNAIKCKIEGSSRYPKEYYNVADNCRFNFLQMEFDYYNPSIILCFGDDAAVLTKRLSGLSNVVICELYHPYAISSAKRNGQTQEERFAFNEKEIETKIKS